MAASLSLNYLGLRLVQIVVLLGGAAFVVRGELSPGGFVGFLLLVGEFYRPLEKIGAVVETYPKGIAGFRRYRELLATAPDIVDRPGAIPAPPLRGEIRFEGVRFGYGDGRPVLDGVDLAVRAVETVAFVGPSGAGKTTLCSLVPRFYEVEAVRITIDGHDIRDLTLASFRGQIGIVQQDVFLFAGTIRENIAYGRLDASEAEIRQAAHRARLDALIAMLPDGLDTVVGERGVKLSGGQKQRLAIAQVFLKKPADPDPRRGDLGARHRDRARDPAGPRRAGARPHDARHRLATIRHADRIAVVSNGRILEQGSHDALVAANGAYRRLHAAHDGIAAAE